MRPLVSRSVLTSLATLCTGAVTTFPRVAPSAGKGFNTTRSIQPLRVQIGAADDAHGDRVAERQIEHQVGAAVRAAAVGIGAGCLRTALELAELRLVADDFDGAAHRSRAIQRALRPAQDFDAIDVVQIGIDDHLPGLRQRGRRQRHFVEIEADRGRRAARRGEAARLELGEPGPRRTHRETRNVMRDFADAADAGGHELVAAQRGDTDRRVQNGGLVLLRGDHDFLDRSGRVRLCRNLLGSGRL